MSEPNSKEKALFRGRIAWKRFRDYITEDQGYTCECCGMTYAPIRRHILNVHHLDPENYEDLNPDKFRVLCVTCHEFVEHMSKRITGKNFRFYKKFPEVFAGLKDFLLYTAQQKGDEVVASPLVYTKKIKEKKK
jgi:hypothetical protein